MIYLFTTVCYIFISLIEVILYENSLVIPGKSITALFIYNLLGFALLSTYYILDHWFYIPFYVIGTSKYVFYILYRFVL